MQDHGLNDFRAAKEKAGTRLGLQGQGALPSNQEIESAIAERNRIFRGESHEAHLFSLRRAALEVMRRLEVFEPRLTGAVLTGHATEHSIIELHLFSDEVEAVGQALLELGMSGRLGQQRLRWRREESEPVACYRFREGEFEFVLTVFPQRGRGNAPLSSVDGRPMRRATASDVEALLK